LAARVVGDESALTNVQCTASGCTNLVQVQFVGKNSPNPNIGTNLKGNDNNNFAPSVGFAWNVPWWGKGKTVVRGGYGINYSGALRNFITVDGVIGTVPGINLVSGGSGRTFNPSSYLALQNVTFPIPLAAGTPDTSPFPVPTTERSLGLTTYNNTAPYTQNWNLEIQREVAKNLTFEARYVGSKGTKLWGRINLNTVNIFENGILDGFNITRAGGNAPLFVRMLQGLNLGSGIINGTTVTGSASLRVNLANGDFRAVANSLNTTNIGVNVPAGQTIAGATLRSSGLFPENFISANPQFTTMEMRNNSDSSNYHSMQTQLTMRPKRGITYQTTWTWSRATGVAGNTPTGGGITATYRDFMNRKADYTVANFQRTHDFRGYGTFELPFGPGKFLGSGTHGLIAHLIEGWQFGSIVSLTTGAPLNVPARNTINRTGTPDIVGDFPRKGEITWGNVFGNYFPQGYQSVADPACARVAAAAPANLNTFCTNRAIADSSGRIILQNAAPGQLGSLGLNPLYGPGSWDFDANLQKKIRFAEARSLTIRIDASNILNHPTPGNPNLDINSGTFGEISTKTGSRTLAGQVRLEF